MKKILFLFVTLCLLLIATSCSKTIFAITTGDENLTSLTKVTDNDEPCIDPWGGDYGKDLFFSVCEKKKYYNIYKKDNPFSSALTQKTSGKNINQAPSYCEIVDKIAFRCQNEGNGTSDIFMMANNGGKSLTQITESTDAFENNPCFSPDGKYLVYDKQSYSVYKKSNFLGIGNKTYLVENSEIWMKNLQTGENILLTKGYQPRFSPDGSKIAYVKYASDAKSTSIWIMSPDGSNQTQITDAKKGFAMAPCWSPDGSKIIFQSANKNQKDDADLFVINVDGNDLTQLTVNKSWDMMPYWTKDGYIYFSSDRGNKKGNYQIWRFRISD